MKSDLKYLLPKVFRNGNLPTLLYANRQNAMHDRHDRPMHRHENLCELLICYHGEGVYTVDRDSYEVRVGDLIYYNAGSRHEVRSSMDTEIGTYCLGFTDVHLAGLPCNHLVAEGDSFVRPAGQEKAFLLELADEIVTSFGIASSETATASIAANTLAAGTHTESGTAAGARKKSRTAPDAYAEPGTAAGARKKNRAAADAYAEPGTAAGARKKNRAAANADTEPGMTANARGEGGMTTGTHVESETAAGARTGSGAAVTGEPSAVRLRTQLMASVFLLTACGIPSAAAPSAAARSPEIAFAAKAYIDHHFTDPLQIPEIARQVGCSDSYLQHAFKELTGFSPLQYILRCRIGQAQTLLISSDYSAAHIASVVGFDSPAYFNRVFRKIVGTTPLQYRTHYLTELRGSRKQL